MGQMTNGRENVCRHTQCELSSLRNEVERLRIKLESIKKHMEIVSPFGYRLSTVWLIADKALSDTNGEGK